MVLCLCAQAILALPLMSLYNMILKLKRADDATALTFMLYVNIPSLLLIDGIDGIDSLMVAGLNEVIAHIT